ncbi:unnamed protein product [Ixodes pacificus]
MVGSSLLNADNFTLRWGDTQTDDTSQSETANAVQDNGSWNASDYDLYSIPSDLWMRYSPGIVAVFCLAYSVVFVMGLLGNSFVVAVVARSPRMRTVTNYFIVNLAMADILVVVFCIPATLVSNIFVRNLVSEVHTQFVLFKSV